MKSPVLLIVKFPKSMIRLSVWIITVVSAILVALVQVKSSAIVKLVIEDRLMLPLESLAFILNV